MAKEVIWIMDESKLADDLLRFPVPVEILPFGHTHILRRLEENGLAPRLRRRDGAPFITDNGNYIADVQAEGVSDLSEVKAKLDGIVGVLETGLFLTMCTRIIVGTAGGAVVYENER